MRGSQANRSVIARRARENGRTLSGPQSATARRASPSPSTNLLLRAQTLAITSTGPVRRTRSVGNSKAQRNSVGRRSEWTLPMQAGGFDALVQNDRRFDQTVSNRAV